MTQTRPADRADKARTTEARTPKLDSPTVLLRNEDDTDHALDVRIAAGDAVLVEDRHTVAGDSQWVIPTSTDSETMQVELCADHGGTASLAIDLQRSKRAAPEFVIRRETIVVAGLN